MRDFAHGAAGSDARPMVAPAPDGGLLLTTPAGREGLTHLTLEGSLVAMDPVPLPGFEELGVSAMAAGVDGEIYVCTADALLRLKIPRP